MDYTLRNLLFFGMLNLKSLEFVTEKQIANFFTNYGLRVLNKTKNDEEVMFRLKHLTPVLTFCLYHRFISKEGIVLFLEKGYFEPQHFLQPLNN